MTKFLTIAALTLTLIAGPVLAQNLEAALSACDLLTEVSERDACAVQVLDEAVKNLERITNQLEETLNELLLEIAAEVQGTRI